MESTRIIEKVKEKLIKELKEKESAVLNEKRRNEFAIEDLEMDIKEYEKVKEIITTRLKEISRQYGSKKKIESDKEIVTDHLLSIINKMNQEEKFECALEYFTGMLKERLNALYEKKQQLEENKRKNQEQVKAEIEKINERFNSNGMRKGKFTLDLQSLALLLVSEKMVNKNNSYDYKAIKEYYENLKEIENIKRIIEKQYNKLINWIENNKKWLPPILNLTTINHCIENLNEVLAYMEQANENKKKIDRVIKQKKEEIKRLTNKIKQSKTEEKVSEMNERIKKIEKISSFEELKMSRQEALKLIGEEEKLYVIVPIPKEVTSLEDIFNYPKRVHIKTDDIEIETTYLSDTITGTINSNNSILNEDTALIIPLDEIAEESIVRMNKDGTLVFNQFEIPKSSKLITSKNNPSQLKDHFETDEYNANDSNLKDEIRKLLGKNYTEDKEEYKTDEKLKNFQRKIYTLGDIRRIAAILNIMHANYFKCATKEITVDGTRTSLNREIKEVVSDDNYADFLEELSEIGFETETDKPIELDAIDRKNEKGTRGNANIRNILQAIEEISNHPKRNIEDIYKKLMNIYLEENPKAKAFYHDEGNSKIKIDGEEINIKPRLPQNKEELEKRFFRKGEDKIYKMMKTAALSNKLAHLYERKIKRILNGKVELGSDEYYQILQGAIKIEDKELNGLVKNRKLMFKAKDILLQLIIEKAEGREDISIGKICDRKGYGIAMDIPGYASIVLHIKTRDLFSLENLKQYHYIDGLNDIYHQGSEENSTIASGILVDGVNRELIEKMKDLKIKERAAILNNLGKREMQNLLVRLGYTSKDFGTVEGRKKIIYELASDEKLNEILEDDELCR